LIPESEVRSPKSEVRGFVVDAGECPYLPGRRFHAFQPASPVDGGLYRVLLDHRFRRAGATVYAPMCPDCHECRPIRIAVADFRPRRDQRRCLARNADLAVSWWPRGMDDERRELWRRYQQTVHDDPAERGPEDFLLADGGIPGGELHARDAAGRLLGVAICDLAGDAWSSVYCFWEPAERRRGLGTFLALAEIATAARQGLRWWYPGFWVRDCAKMAYKARFGPFQVLVDGRWHTS
jgi:arginine-tRNA-protein transferase